jgi:hypothetical protein
MHYSYLTHLSALWLSVEDEWYKMVTVVLTSAQVLSRKLIVKGTVSRDFLLLVFSRISFPPAPEYFIETVSIFFENLQR